MPTGRPNARKCTLSPGVHPGKREQPEMWLPSSCPMMDPSYVNPRSPSRCTGPSLLRNIGSKKPLVRLMVPADADCEKRTNAKRAKDRTSVGRIRRLSAKAARASISEGARLVNLFSLRACPVLRWVDSGSNDASPVSAFVAGS